jgi:hypothetical protein
MGIDFVEGSMFLIRLCTSSISKHEIREIREVYDNISELEIIDVFFGCDIVISERTSFDRLDIINRYKPCNWLPETKCELLHDDILDLSPTEKKLFDNIMQYLNEKNIKYLKYGWYKVQFLA